MRPLTYLVAASIDGFIAGPDGDVSAFPMGDHLDWQVRSYPETLPAAFWETLGVDADATFTFDTVVMGRRTYEVGLRDGVTDPYPHLEQVVVSRTLDPDELPVRVVAGDPLTLVRDLKQQPGAGIWLCGGGVLAAQVADEIDRLVIKRAPIVLGRGTPMFDGGAGELPAGPWRRVDERVFDSGVVALTYERT